MSLEKILLSEVNIYKAIYCLDTAIFEKRLLSKKDQKLLEKLNDKYDFKYINEKIIPKVQEVIKDIIKNDNLFDVEVYFKLKKFENDKAEKRPIHTTSLINQIAMISMLNLLLYDFGYENESLQYKKSDLLSLIPENFYGNIPSGREEELFMPWNKMYKEFSAKVNETFYEAYNNNKYLYEVTLDLKNFFPSINPYIVYKFILNKVKIIHKRTDYELLKKIIFKLLNFKITNLEESTIEEYYGMEEIGEDNSIFYSKGIAQGLPQSYLFGNICMIEVAEVFGNIFKGESYYYVDDSYIYTYENIDGEIFKEKLKKVNDNIYEFTKKYEKYMEGDKKYINFDYKI